MCTMYDDSEAVRLARGGGVGMEKKMKWRSLEGYDLVIVWAPFTAFQHSCIIYTVGC